jgi:hypothetical protein
MDNLDKIKYKRSTGSFIKKIDIATGQLMAEFNTDQPKRYAGLIAEMQEWEKIEGNEIEPQFTEAELEAKATKEAEDALENQKQTLKNLIKDNEYHLSHTPESGRRFAAQWSDWDIVIKKWESQYEQVKAGNLVEIEPKPVFD